MRNLVSGVCNFVRAVGGSARCLVLLASSPLLFLLSCETVRPVPVPPDELTILRAEVRLMIKQGCGSCHTTSLPTAKPAALAVFDLAKEDWSAEMTEQELNGFRRRTRDYGDPLAQKVEALVAAELARSLSIESDGQQ